jgi:hypothetical protein
MSSFISAHWPAIVIGGAVAAWILIVIALATPVYTIGSGGTALTARYLARGCVGDACTNGIDFPCGAQNSRFQAALAFNIIALFVLTAAIVHGALRLAPLGAVAGSRALDQVILGCLVVTTCAMLIAWPVSIAIFTTSNCGLPATETVGGASVGPSAIFGMLAWLCVAVIAKIEHWQQGQHAADYHTRATGFAKSYAAAWHQAAAKNPALCRCCASADAAAAGVGSAASGQEVPSHVRIGSGKGYAAIDSGLSAGSAPEAQRREFPADTEQDAAQYH